jgi:hypothetical protein
VSGLNCFNQKLASTFGAFLQWFSQVKTKLYTDMLPSQVSHHNTANSTETLQWKFFHQQ